MSSQNISVKNRTRAGGILVACSLIAVGGVVAAPLATPAPAQAASPFTATLKWQHELGSPGKPVALSSPMVATLDGKGSSVVIGDRSGYETAFHLSDGSVVFKSSTGGVAVDSTASVLGSGTSARLFFGEGTSGAPAAGGYRSISSSGKTVWSVKPKAQPTGSATRGVMSSLAIGTLQSANDVVGGSMGQMQHVMNAQTGRTGVGFPWFQADSNFSTPAVADTSGKSDHDIIIEGGDSTAGVAFGTRYANGGHIRLLYRTGNNGSGSPSGGLKCQYNTTQVVQSSPAVGNVLSKNAWAAVVGTGTFWKGASDTNKLIAIDQNCKLAWKASLSGSTQSSPALADTRGNGHPTIVQGTLINASSGRVYSVDGSNGHVIWQTAIAGGVYGGIVTADLTGKGYQDVVVPTPGGVFVLDGKTGHQIARLGQGYGFQNSALITNDPNGSIGITVAGYNARNSGIILHYQLSGAGVSGANVNKKGAWPMFHHDQKLTGDANTVLPAKP
ncbi:Outer membrane protein assembly factor BamB [Frondihabitans sp. 762G35]|uniref:outer membrane protein assembly factor BamB family protein n=1 Tax=Frondihabitans sp. 762G35 TaxID=1446794 RepID=UPI000D202D0B|nr:PQQ-binding-like beta-propeller repeat protein [Frondihabitans sp. 762G35]ARC57821.1 Outer membrane protein assembly factor BamB [Frondihabitans sp. 762G35]